MCTAPEPSMHLFLLRHGEAGAPLQTDADRELTPRGRLEVQSLVRRYRDRLPIFDTVYCSPYTRARQTAAVVLGELEAAVSLVVTPALEPGASVSEVARLLELAAGNNLLLVTHQPLVGNLASWLVDDPAMTGSFGTATLAALDLDYVARGSGRVCWQVHAR